MLAVTDRDGNRRPGAEVLTGPGRLEVLVRALSKMTDELERLNDLIEELSRQVWSQVQRQRFRTAVADAALSYSLSLFFCVPLAL